MLESFVAFGQFHIYGFVSVQFSFDQFFIFRFCSFSCAIKEFRSLRDLIPVLCCQWRLSAFYLKGLFSAGFGVDCNVQGLGAIGRFSVVFVFKISVQVAPTVI